MNIVKLTLPIIFEANGIAKGKRKSQCVFFYSEIEVDIPTVDEMDAPLAITYPASPMFDPNIDGKVEIRSFDGKLYRPALEEMGGGRFAPLSTHALIERVGGCQTYNNPLLQFAQSWRYNDYVSGCREIGPYIDEEWRHISESSEDATIAAAREHASRFLFIDGMVWEQTPEPVYQVVSKRGPFESPDDGEFEHIYQLFQPIKSVEDKDYSGKVKHESRFRLDAFDEASAYCERTYGRPLDPAQQATVLMPEVLSHAPEAPALLHSLKRALDISWNSVAHAPVDTMITWGEFRDQLWVALNDPDPDVEDLERLAAKAACYSADENAHEGAAKLIVRAVARWEDRPFDLDHAGGLRP